MYTWKLCSLALEMFNFSQLNYLSSVWREPLLTSFFLMLPLQSHSWIIKTDEWKAVNTFHLVITSLYVSSVSDKMPGNSQRIIWPNYVRWTEDLPLKLVRINVIDLGRRGGRVSFAVLGLIDKSLESDLEGKVTTVCWL